VAAALAIMAFGNMTGAEAYADSFSRVDPLNYQGSVLAEIDESKIPEDLPDEFSGNMILAGRTLDEPVFRVVCQAPVPAIAQDKNPEALAAETSLEMLRRAFEYPLSEVYPQTSTGATVAERPGAPALVLPEFSGAKAAASASPKHIRLSQQGAPLVVLPVFPGTSGEWDMERAFREAGAKTRFVIFENRSRKETGESIKEMARAFKEAQIIALSGGLSAGGEPDGSAKFIVDVLRNEYVAEAVGEFLDKRGGLILGIGDGFQALVKTGLVPYGRIAPAAETMPAIAHNTIGRYVSRMVRTRVMPNVSPWLSLEEPGAVHIIPVSHAEGRVVIADKDARALFAAGQVPFCYVDADGNPTMAEPDNPGGSAFAIEALSSPDGRILGKMGHSERSGDFVHTNIPGNKHQSIFQAGVKYFNR
jgi:phosphoribosylformylglycinamidine synthase